MILIFIIVFLIFLYLGYIIFSTFYFQKLRKKIKCVIHVNGIRGKSTVTRLIASGLMENGYKVFCKTTGTIPMFIDTKGEETRIKRIGPANIKEQLSMIKKAAKENADFLVIECMAVSPEYQYITEHLMLKSDINVITNVRFDHMDVMGETKEEIARSLSNTIPKSGKVILGNNDYYDVFKEIALFNSSEIFVARKHDYLDNLDTFEENLDVALEVARILDIDEDSFFKGMMKYRKDPGALNTLKRENTTFFNGFSINDADSISNVYDKITANIDKKEVSLVLNERDDRAFRVIQHVEMLKKMEFKNLYLIGSNKTYIYDKLKKENINVLYLKEINVLLNEKYVFGLGNIKKGGMKIIDFFEEGDKK